MKRNSLVPLLSLALAVLAVYFLFPQWFKLDFSTKPNLNLGLDLQGGLYLKMEIDMDKLPKDASGNPRIQPGEAVDRALEILRNRVDALGVAEPILQKEGDRWVVIQLPGLKDPERAEQIIGQTAQLNFQLVSERVKLSDLLDANGNTVVSKIPDDVEVLNSKDEQEGGRLVVEKRILLTGESLENAVVDFSQSRFGQPVISFSLTPDGAKRFADLTADNVGRRLAIVLDGKVQSAPVIKSRIGGGKGIIEGSFTVEEAKNLALVLRSGALPAPLKIINRYVVGPTLGADTIRKGTLAAVLGTIVVLIYMAFYYRLSGLIADLALGFNLLFLLGALAALHATLTLPGLAGIVLTMGMSVDSNVIIFERIREELKAGKTVRTAIDAGYSHAFWTIVDSHLTSLFTGVVLFQFGTGPIKGFAVSLCLGVAISMFTALFITKAVFDIRKQYSTLSI